MRKQLIALVCVLCFSVMLTACGSSESNENAQGTGTPSASVTGQPSNTPTEAPTSTPTETPTPTPTPEPHEHSYTSAVTKEATCTEVGETTYTCSCGDTYKEDIAKINHTESDWVIVTEVTSTTDGLQHKVCTVCGEETASEVISCENFVVDSGVLADGKIEWKIVGTTLYISGTGAIPDFKESGGWFDKFGDSFPDRTPDAWVMYYDDVDNIVLSEGITGIGDNNFCGFSKVTSFEFPSTLTKIGRHGMNGMGLTSLSIPRNISSLDVGSFQNLRNITELTVPSNIKIIPDACFSGCSNLSKIIIEEGVTEIGETAFAMAPYVGANGERIGLCDGFDIYVPESVTEIGDYAFVTGESKGPITIYGKAGSYIEQWVNTKNVQSEVTFVAQ